MDTRSITWFSTRSIPGAALLLAFCLSVETQRLHASVIVQNIGAVVQATINDADLLALTNLFGLGPGTLNYASTTTNSQWTGILSGAYLGAGVNVDYSGDLSQYPIGQITWTTSGFYGGAPWSGNGSASFANTASGFNMLFLYSISVGSHSADYNFAISADVSPTGDVRFDDANSSGSLISDGVVILDANFSYIQFRQKWIDDATEHNNNRIVSTGTKPIANGVLSMTNTIETVPEPTTLFLVGAGFIGCVWRSRRRARIRRN